MSCLVKIVLVLVLMLAVPLRGLAAAGMPLCGSAAQDHHAAGQAHAHDAGHENAHAHDTDGPQLHDGGHDHPLSSSVCSACGASCAAVMAPSSLDLSPPMEPGSTPIAFVELPFSGFTPEGADRPPLL